MSKKPSWSVVGIALPAITAIIAIVGALTTDQRALLLSIAAFSLGNTALAVQRVYAAFRHGRDDDIERRQVNNKFLGWIGRRGHQPRLAFSHDGSLLVTSGGTLVWDIKEEKDLIKSADLQGSIFAVHPSKNILAVAGTMTGDDDYERLSLLDPATGERGIRLQWLDNPEFDLGRASCLAFSSDGRMLAAGYEKTILVWDSGSGRVVNQLTYDPQVAHIGLCALAFGPNGKALAAAHAYVGPVLWDLDSGERAWEVPVYPTGRREHTAVAFSPDGGVLAVITSGHYPAAGSSHGPALVHLWDVASQEFLGEVETQVLGPAARDEIPYQSHDIQLLQPAADEGEDAIRRAHLCETC